MIHPHTELRLINTTVGYGVFATQFIPKGTITYVKDSLEIEISPTQFMQHQKEMQTVIEKYSYIDERGFRILSWDFGKYVNHCCQCNTMSTGYGFEVAIKDIQAGEQITDEYGVFNLTEEMNLECGNVNCRKKISPNDFDTYYKNWDEKIQLALPKLHQVNQPLMPFIDSETIEKLDTYFQNAANYKSIYALKFLNSTV